MSRSLDEFASHKLAALDRRGLRRKLVVSERRRSMPKSDLAASARRPESLETDLAASAREPGVLEPDLAASELDPEITGQQLATNARDRATDGNRPVTVVVDGEPLISFSCNDYLGLSQHPEVIAAAIDATRRYGAGAGAARLVTGNHPLYPELEAKLAALKGTEAAVVFGSGYLANIGILPALVGPGDLVLMDELSHSCLLSGAQLSHAHIVQFAHNDTDAVAAVLERERPNHRHCLIVTEGVFSMEGDLAPLSSLAQLAERFDAWLLTDDAHGLGVVGGGRGSAFVAPDPDPAPDPDSDSAHAPAAHLQMGTLSKAVGAYGGYLCATQSVVELMRNRARSFVYSTALPPGTIAAASKALDLIASDARLVAAPLARARLFTSRLGLPPAESAIVPLRLGTPDKAIAASRRLQHAGFLVKAIRPPTVPAGTSRLRFAFCALHDEADVRRLADVVASLPEFAEHAP